MVREKAEASLCICARRHCLDAVVVQDGASTEVEEVVYHTGISLNIHVFLFIVIIVLCLLSVKCFLTPML